MTCRSRAGKGDQPRRAAGGTPGVTQDTIKIAVIDRAGQVKVPTASIEESMQSLRGLVQRLRHQRAQARAHQDRLQADGHLEATKEACNAGVFALGGSGSVTDSQGAQAMVDCGLVEVPAYTATAARA